MLRREPVGNAESYRGRELEVRFMGPDLLAYVDGVELSGFFLNREAALGAGRRYVDEAEKSASR